MNAKEYYFFGILEKVGYKKDKKITLGEFKNNVNREKLYLVANIEIYPKCIYQADSVFLLNENEKYVVLTTGERGNGVPLEFDDIGHALNYMLAFLRLKKLYYSNESNKDKNFNKIK